MNKIFVALFAICSMSVMASSPILPTPNSIVEQEGEFKLPKGSLSVDCNNEMLLNYIETEFPKKLNIKVEPGKNAKLTITIADERSDAEDYKLEITNKGVKIDATGYSGAFYGVQSLMQLLRSNSTAIPAQIIDDAPRFAWRSQLVDDARHFKGVDELKKLIDAMAELKMNRLQWHLTDDSGWRLEIKKYPLLTEVGSYRKDTEAGTWGSGKTQGVSHSGFYTQQQAREIVEYAKASAIKVVPEIEMPGHASAAVAAYPWIGSTDETIEVPILFGKLYSIFNVIDPKVESFLQDVLSELIDLFGTGVVHIGGDEVRFDQWEKNPTIAKYKEDKKFNSFMDIQIEFTNKMSHFIDSKGVTMMGWNEILGKNLHEGEISFADPSQQVAKNVIVQFWKGDIKELVNAAKGGYRLVNSLHTSTYMDYGHKSIPLKNAYAFDPVPADLPTEYHSNIIGLGCQGWSEWLPTVDDLHKKVFPRLAAYAEVGWTEPKNKDYDNFRERLKPVVEGWKKMGINPYEGDVDPQ